MTDNILLLLKPCRIFFYSFIIVFFSHALSCTNSYSKEKTASLSINKRADKIHKSVFKIDTHVDTPISLQNPNFNMGRRHRFNLYRGKVDFPRIREGGINAIFFAVFIRQEYLTKKWYKKKNRETLKIISIIHRTLRKNKKWAKLALSTGDIKKINRSGKIAVLIGIENGYAIGRDLSLVKKYYKLGVRYITLCHTTNNDICDSSTDHNGPSHRGLSEFGKKVVREMNRTGMIIDVSHISDLAFHDVMKITGAPVIASHSNAREICETPRNLSDSMLEKLSANGGIINISLVKDYVKVFPENTKRDKLLKALRKKYNNFSKLSNRMRGRAFVEQGRINRKFLKKLPTVADVVDHIEHVVKVAGIGHVGIGSDFDGGARVEGCLDISQMGSITRELVKRGYNKEEIGKIWGGNFMRVFEKVELVAREGE
ncbi:dipeptidase [Spirochaetota bacterium]